MEAPTLYRVPKDQLPQLADLFAEAFQNDPLYGKLIPDEEIRRRALPKYFRCYLDIYLGHCQIYADSPSLQGAVVVLAEEDLLGEYSPLHCLSDSLFLFRLLWALVGVDHSGRTALSFIKNHRFLTSKWAAFVGKKHIHIDFLAVSPQRQGQGIASRLVQPFLDYADGSACRTTLETHNPGNLDFYRRLGFRVVEELPGGQNFCQYCLER